jgi:hypothetical protein
MKPILSGALPEGINMEDLEKNLPTDNLPPNIEEVD